MKGRDHSEGICPEVTWVMEAEVEVTALAVIDTHVSSSSFFFFPFANVSLTQRSCVIISEKTLLAEL